jgi:glycosyltransferase involved in cell wall biosynthesis
MSGDPQSRASTGPKVWIVAPSPPPYGGMSVQAEMLERRLVGEGIAAEVIATNPALPRPLKTLERIPVLRTMLREAQYLGSLVRILRYPGVVHHFSASYLFFFLHSAPLLLLGRSFGAKIVLNYRGGKAADFLRSWSWAALPLLRGADKIVVPSEFLQRVFQDFGLASMLLPNLADTELFPFVEREQFSPRLFVSRSLEPMYDVECVLRAFRIVQRKIPQAVLGIAGEGSEANRLRSLVREWRLNGVHFYGTVPHKAVPSLYQRHDIYVNASRVDNFPGTLVEAACAGLPIVTTRAGGIPEMIRHRENGLLCEVGDPDALATCVLQILQHRDFARQLARTARSWAEQFSWRSVFPQLMQCYGLGAGHGIPVLGADRILVH